MSTENLEIPQSLVDAVATYLNHLTIERGLSDNTLAAYRRDLDRYLRYLTQERVTDVHQISVHHVTGFLQALSSGSHQMGSLARSSINRILVAARGWHRFLYREEMTQTNPAAGVRLSLIHI